MSALSVQVPFPVFQDRDGQPLENGYVWIGTANLYPITNAVPVFFDAALTIPAAQPLRTINGYISNAGTPAQVYVNGANYSILVQDSKGSMVYSFPEGTGISPNACGVEYDPPFTGAVSTTVCVKLAEIVSPKDFGAVGDGVTDDSAAFQLAVDSGAKAINLSGLTYAIASTVAMDVNGQRMFNGQLIFTGTSAATGGTQRIIDVKANYVTLENIIFDGNADVTEPANALVYVDNDCQNLAIRSCTFQNITSYKYLNNIYGLQVSSYNVTNFEISNCLFKSLYIYNNGSTGAEVIAGNFVGGLFFYPIPGSPSQGLQTFATRGIVSDCTFTDIKSIVNNDSFVDADAIRTSPNINFDQRLYITVDNCLFHTVQGRAFKGNTEGATVQNCVVQPFMETAPGSGVSMSRAAFTISHNTVLRNIRITTSALPVRGGVEFTAFDAALLSNTGTTIENIYIGLCQTGINLRVFDGATGPLENITIRNVTIDSVSSNGIRFNGPTEAAVPTLQQNIVVENVKIKGAPAGGAIEGFAFFGDNTFTSGGYFFNNIEIENCYAFWQGNGFVIDGLKMTISSSLVSITNFYYLSFLGNSYSLKNIDVNALGIGNSFITALKPYFIGIAGFNKSVKGFVLRVPDALEKDYPHVQFLGRDSNYEDVEYHGPGFFNMDSSSFYGTANADNKRWTASNFNRFGNGATDKPFLRVTQTAPIASQFGFINGLADYRPTSASTVLITEGTDYVVYNVASRSTNPSIVDAVSVTSANINGF
jgi:hypothetical protein